MNNKTTLINSLAGYFSKHLVPIHFYFKKGNIDHHAVISTFLVSVWDEWFLITAGHCLRAVEDNIRKYGCIIQKCRLVDYVGDESIHPQPIPFDYTNSFKAHLEDDKYDYGVIYVNSYYKNLLLSNNIEPLNEEVWEKQPENPDFYCLLGIPDELVESKNGSLFINPSLNYVERCEKKPDCFEDTDAPTFYGKVVLNEQMKTIKGMSGGPIFSLRKTESGLFKYWLCAVQSRWVESERLIAACLIKPFALELKKIVENNLKNSSGNE